MSEFEPVALGELRREGAGRLTVFLGAAPGVGKTYAMLSRARDARRQGVDVVAGIVETHGRAETQALLDGLELLPRRRVDYRGHTVDELDLDALLARRPQLALVDELAHTNAPGSRHERRWQDVLELLDAGIDVHTTVNIQHLESLNDVVHRIIGVRVAETVPDVLFDRLRDLVLVDLPPGELIQRLKQGKVYVPEQAAHALQAFFSPSNLTALRELALQAAADRVDADLREAQAARGLPGASLRRGVLVAIDGRGQSEYLVRVGRRLAERRDAPWTVAFVQGGAAPDAERQREVDAAFALARRLGGSAVLLHGGVVDALLDEAGRSGISTLVIGRTRERPLARMINRTLTQQLIQRGAHYELTIVGTPAARARARRWRVPDLDDRLRAYLIAAGGAAAAIAVAALAETWLGLTDLSMVFIVAVLLVAARTRMSAAVLAAVLCFLGYNYFFIEPRYTLLIGARHGVATVVLFLGAALVAGRLASRLRAQVQALRAANAHATWLQTLTQRLASAADARQVAAAGRDALRRAFEADVVIVPGEMPMRTIDSNAATHADHGDRVMAATHSTRPRTAPLATGAEAAWPVTGPDASGRTGASHGARPQASHDEAGAARAGPRAPSSDAPWRSAGTDVPNHATAASDASPATAAASTRDGGGDADALDDKGRAAADWALKHRQSAGRFTDTLSGSAWWVLPMTQARGIVALRLDPGVERLGDEQRRLAEAMIEEVAQALQRVRLVQDLEDARVEGETERLRSALLSSVSHDLRSPLASIIGAASSLESYGTQMSQEDRRALLETVRLEGERLDRYIQNLLDMTRLGHGGLALSRDWIGVDELIGAAVARLQRYLPDARFERRIAPDLAPLWVHPALLEQALFNVLENAAKFSPAGAAITIEARDGDDGRLVIEVSDRGPGIPEDERRRVFDMFYSVERGDRGRGGTGLGLTICQGMVGAHGGSVDARPGRDGRGTTIRITLPRIAPGSGP